MWKPITRAIEKGGVRHVVFQLDFGLGLACSFAILNAMWLELRQDNEERDGAGRG